MKYLHKTPTQLFRSRKQPAYKKLTEFEKAAVQYMRGLCVALPDFLHGFIDILHIFCYNFLRK